MAHGSRAVVYGCQEWLIGEMTSDVLAELFKQLCAPFSCISRDMGAEDYIFEPAPQLSVYRLLREYIQIRSGHRP